MNKILLFIIICFISESIWAQYPINAFIQENYSHDARLLALRDVLNDPSDPDFDNPFFPESRAIPYLEKLSAIYDNPNNNPAITALFEDFNIHVNEEYNFPINYKSIAIRVNTAMSWVEQFKTTGISGITELDDIVSTYELSINNFWEFNTCGCTIFFLETNYDFLNMYALIDDFEMISDIDYAEVFVDNLNLRFNYTGIPYLLGPDYVSTCDILINGNEFTFCLYSGDCPAGCIWSECSIITVTDDFQVLSTNDIETKSFSVFPNPAKSFVNISTEIQGIIYLTVYDTFGKQIISERVIGNQVDVSNLKAGLYFFKIVQEQKSEIKKIVIQ